MASEELQLGKEFDLKKASEYTLDAHEVFASALEEAKRLNHNYLGSEHLLHGLILSAPKPLSTIFSSLEISPTAVHEQIEDIIGVGASSPENVVIRPSLRVRAIVEGAESLARLYETKYIDSTLITLSLCREVGVATQVLVNLNVGTSVLAEKILTQAGFDETQIDDWFESADAYADESLYSTITDLTKKQDEPSLNLPDGVEW